MLNENINIAVALHKNITFLTMIDTEYFVMQITCVHQVILISIHTCTVFTFYI